MKKVFFYSILLLSVATLWGCKKADYPGRYPGAVVSPYVSIFDVRDLYKGTEVTLSRDAMFGSTQITAVVVSDHSGGNLPAGLLVVQEARRLSQLRGISIAIGADAAKYVPGDSVTISVEGGVLKRVDGLLQITGVPSSAITKISSGNVIPPNRVPSSQILANPEKFESTLCVIVKAGFNPLPGPADILAGDKLLNDGFGDITLHTEASASFANNKLSFNANYYGIVFTGMAADKSKPHVRVRTGNDIVVLSSTVEVQPIIITGFMPDVEGGDGNYEYIQLMATRDINFATNPYSVVTTNNAGTSTPTGAPLNGWGTGGLRTYKFNLTTGFAAKGTFFYVGGSTKLINGASSTSMAASNWIRAFNYSTTAGDGGTGTATSGLFANSGNASGVAVFEGTTVNLISKPVDVLFVATGGVLYQAPDKGYRIGNTDWYDMKNPITLEDQPFYRNGSNTLNLSYPTGDQGIFNKMGGEYNVTLGRWMKARTQTFVDLSKTSPLSEIEGEGTTKLVQ